MKTGDVRTGPGSLHNAQDQIMGYDPMRGTREDRKTRVVGPRKDHVRKSRRGRRK